MKFVWKSSGVVMVTAAALMMGACQSTRVEQPMSAELVNSQEVDDQMDFWHDLAQRPMVANDEAFHALLLFVDGQDTAGSYEARVENLKDRKMLPGSFDAPADHAITRGDLAVALVGALEIKGGVMLRLMPTSRRYATRELAYEGLFPQSSEHQTFTGEQFIGIIGKAEDYQRANTPEAPESAPANDVETATPGAPEMTPADRTHDAIAEPVVPAPDVAVPMENE